MHVVLERDLPAVQAEAGVDREARDRDRLDRVEALERVAERGRAPRLLAIAALALPSKPSRNVPETAESASTYTVCTSYVSARGAMSQLPAVSSRVDTRVVAHQQRAVGRERADVAVHAA